MDNQICQELDWEKDIKQYKDIGDGFLAHPQGYNIYKDGFLYDLESNILVRTDKDLIAVVKKLGK